MQVISIVVLVCGITVIGAPAQTLTTLITFDGTDGSAPAASLIQASDGNLYGTTEYGGPINGCEGGFNPCGTVFKITTSGTLTTLHTFVYSDGAFPVSPVVQGNDGNFYGTNQGEGDSGGSGAIFKMTPDGTVTVLSFTSSVGGAGARPRRELLRDNPQQLHRWHGLQNHPQRHVDHDAHLRRHGRQ